MRASFASRLALLSGALLLSACAADTEGLRPLRDAALGRALLGAWCNSTDGGRSCWAYDQFFEDGSLRACGRQPDERQPFSGGGPVSIEGDVMCYAVTRATPNFWLPPGSRYCTRIVGVGASSHVYEDRDTGLRYTLQRVPIERVDCGAAPGLE